MDLPNNMVVTPWIIRINDRKAKVVIRASKDQYASIIPAAEFIYRKSFRSKGQAVTPCQW
jgi:hypothetical protein